MGLLSLCRVKTYADLKEAARMERENTRACYENQTSFDAGNVGTVRFTNKPASQLLCSSVPVTKTIKSCLKKKSSSPVAETASPIDLFR